MTETVDFRLEQVRYLCLSPTYNSLCQNFRT